MTNKQLAETLHAYGTAEWVRRANRAEMLRVAQACANALDEIQRLERQSSEPSEPLWDINSIERIARQQGVFGRRDGNIVTITGPIVISGPSLNRDGVG